MSNPDFQDGYADVNGVRLHYVSCGEGELILFAHGFPEYWRMWKDQLAEFGKDHRAVAFDMRGYNLSSRPEGVEDYGIDALVESMRRESHDRGAKHSGVLAYASDCNQRFRNTDPVADRGTGFLVACLLTTEFEVSM